MVASKKDWTYDPFEGAQKLFADPNMASVRPKGGPGCLYVWSETFFSLVADGLGRLRQLGSGSLKLELVLADGYAWMDGVRFGTILGRDGFPVTYDRIHTSNVPDYM